MSHYDDVRNRIHRQMVPLPILYRDDYSIDHAGLAKYVAWHMENDTRNFCLTFTYSQLDFITPQEIVDVTRTVMEVVRDDAVFIPCTGGGPLHVAIETVQAFEKIGAPAAFVHLPEHCLQNAFQCGELYVKYIRDVARETTIPLLAVALGIPGTTPRQTMLPVKFLEDLCEEEQFIGIKDDIYILANRLELVQKLSGRVGITGGGMFTHYIFFHHWPNQGEFAGIYNPKRGQRMFELLDENNYLEVLKMIEEDGQSGSSLPGIHWMAKNQVVFYGMGFAETYRMRPPIASATEEQARAIIEYMHQAPTLFERVAR